MKDPLVHLLYVLFKKENIAVDQEELSFQLLSHPTYPSLHSITGVLDHFNIENAAFRVPVAEDTLQHLEGSFLTQIKNETGEHFVVCTKTKEYYKLIFNKEHTQNASAQEFLQIWTGVIVAIEDKQTDTATTALSKKNYKQIPLYLTIALLISLFFYSTPNLYSTLHFVLTCIGIIISTLIVQRELGMQSKALDAFCSGEQDTSKNCDAVLNSEGATWFGFLKLSDVGIIYFSASLLFWLLSSFQQNTNYTLLSTLSVAAIPFTIYSIYYQFSVVKKWCSLCLSIVSILWLQAGLIYFDTSIFNFLNLDIVDYLIILFSFIATTTSWFYVFPHLKHKKELKELKIEHVKFKRNFSLFEAMLAKSEPINTNIENKNEIILGNKTPNPELLITIITNPLCGHCREVHTIIEQLLKNYQDKVQVLIRFNVPTKNLDHDGLKITTKLTEIYNTKGEKLCLEAMHEIYGDMPAKTWLDKWGTFQDETYLDTLKAANNWCIQNNKNFTPEILIEGRTYPKEYGRKEILYFIEELIEQKQLNS